MSRNPYDRNPYDEVAYDSPPHSETRPENLYRVASLFGFEAADFVTARVLELGCAAGSNIIPLAAQYPKATFVGIDYSQKQIESGKQHIDNLQLKNIRLDCASIVDMGPEYGKFDYIIAHGVYSWVPDEVRDHVMRVCKQQLDLQGIALVSFNTYPGWKAVSNVRELMLMHTKNIDDPIKKAAEARKIVSFVKKNVPGENSPWAQELQMEIDGPNFNQDYYILHDYLEENNCPVYFKDFMRHVKQHDLDYLTDLEFTTRSPYCLTGDAKKMILEKSDVTDAEQYLDFIINRRFRRALICHQGIPKSREVTTKLFDRYKISSRLKAVTQCTTENLTDSTSLLFESDQLDVESDEPLLKAALHYLGEKNGAIKWEKLVEYLGKEFPTFSKDVINEKLNALNFEELMILHAVDLSLGSAVSSHTLTAKPKASDFARYQTKFSTSLTNLKHRQVDMDQLSCLIMPLLDGKNTIQEIVKLFKKKMKTADIDEIEIAAEDGLQSYTKEIILDNAKYIVNEYIKQLAKQDFLH